MAIFTGDRMIKALTVQRCGRILLLPLGNKGSTPVTRAHGALSQE